MTSKRSRRNYEKYKPKEPEYHPNNIRNLRMKMGLTQAELAEKIGVNRVTITNLERDGHRPRHSIACDLAELFGVTVDYINGEEEASIYIKYTEQTPPTSGLYIVWHRDNGPAADPALAWYESINNRFVYVDRNMKPDGVINFVECYRKIDPVTHKNIVT